MRATDNDNKPSIVTMVLLFLTIFIVGKMLTSDNGTKTHTDITPIINISNTNPNQNLTKLDFPENGKTNYYLNSEAIAPFVINTESGQNYIIKLVDSDTNKTALTFLFVVVRELILKFLWVHMN